MHLDLDGAEDIYRVHGWRYPAEEPDDLFVSGLRRALDVFEAQDIRATLFVIAQHLADSAKLRLLREAVARGHEIASHSVTHRWLTTLPRAEQRRELIESRHRLEQALGVPVRGFRAPGFRLSRQELALVQEAGYAYDSSLFARWWPAADTEGATELVELFLPPYRPLPVPCHPSYALVLGTWYFDLGLRRSAGRDAPFVLLFHLTDFADPLPARMLRGWRSRLFTLSHLDGEQKRRRCEAMLAAVRRAYTLTATEAVIRTLTAPATRTKREI